MGNVFVDISTSLDGYVTGPNDDVGRGLGEGGECLHDWVFGGPWTYDDDVTFAESGVGRELIDEAFARIGAVIMGRRVFDIAEGWGEDPPFRVPCFVLTHRGQEALVKGATTFTFVTDGIDSALSQAREAAGDKDISVMGGANAIQQFVRAGVVDEIQIHLAPVLLGAGTRLFQDMGEEKITLERTRVIESPFATHLRFRVVRESDLPPGLPRPAQRALAAAGYRRLEQLTEVSEAELRRLHGVGPKAIRLLRDSFATRGLSFRVE